MSNLPTKEERAELRAQAVKADKYYPLPSWDKLLSLLDLADQLEAERSAALDLLEQVRPWLRYFTYPNLVRKPGKLSSDELEDLCDAIDVALGPEETNYE